MTTATDVIRVAANQNGYTEGPGNNETKFWAELDAALQGQPWCACFVSWAFKHAGHPLPAMDKPYGFVYVPNGERWAKNNGKWRNTAAPGLVAVYGTTTGVHTGIVADTHPGGVFDAWEGNTETSNDTDGGHVMLRQRGPSWVRGFIDFGLDNQPAPPAPQPVVTTYPGDNVHSTSFNVSSGLDGQGNGYIDIPQVDAAKVISVAFDVPDPKGGYPATPPRWAFPPGQSRLVMFGGTPGVKFTGRVWTAD